MVIVQIRSGLGNQMFQYALGRQLATKSNSQLRLDTGFYADYPLRKYELDSFAIEAKKLSRVEEVFLRGALSNRFPALGRVAGSLLGGPFTVLDDQQKGFDESIFDVCGTVYLRGFWQSLKYFSEIRPLLLKEFSVSLEPDERDRSMLPQITNSNSVCIHIRRGDNASDAKTAENHGACTIQYFLDAIKCIEERIDNPTFFVFSEDVMWAKASLPSRQNFRFIDYSSRRRPAYDLRLMQMCKHFIISNSTFGWWAAWLGDSPGKTVVAPKTWYKTYFMDADLLPSHWITLHNELT